MPPYQYIVVDPEKLSVGQKFWYEKDTNYFLVEVLEIKSKVKVCVNFSKEQLNVNKNKLFTREDFPRKGY